METTSAGAERLEPGDSEQDEEGDVYEVERIVDQRTEKGEVLYRVRWKNYTSDDDTWEPEAHLADCQEVLLAYQKRVAESKKEATGVEQVQAVGSRAGQTICSLAAAPQGIVGTQQKEEENVMNDSLHESYRDPHPQKLPMKSDLFDADSESESDRSKREEQLPKKKKKSKAEVEDVSVEPIQRERKKKKRRKEKEQWKPVPGPEFNGNDLEEAEKDSIPPAAPSKKTVHTKKRLLLSDEDEEEEISVLKQHAKDKVKDRVKVKKDIRAEVKKKVSRRKAEDNMAGVEEDEPSATAEDDLNSEVHSESASLHTDDTTATDSYELAEGFHRSGEEATAKPKRSKEEGVRLQGIRALIQEKRKSMVQQATPPLRESTHQKLRNLLSSQGQNKAERSTDDEHLLHSSDSSDAAVSVRRKTKAKAKGQESAAQKLSAIGPGAARHKDADETKPDGPGAGSVPGSAPPAKKQKDSMDKEEQSGSTNLFEKFLLNCEAKDRVPRRQLVHTPSTDTRGELKNKAAKAEKRTKSVKELVASKPELEKGHREGRSPEAASQQIHSPLEEEERLSRTDFSPEGRDRTEQTDGSREAARGRPDDKSGELAGRHKISPDDLREKKSKLEVRGDRQEKKAPETSLDVAEESSTATGARWKERKRKREDGDPRVCDDVRETREPATHPDKPQDRGQASINLGVDLKLDWMTLEDFQKHLNGEDEVLSASTISPSELRDAVKSGDYLAVKLALNSKEDYNLDQEDSSGMSLAMLAAAGGQDDILRLLIKKGARINSRQKNGSTALMHAAEKNFLTTVAILLEAGAHVNAQMQSGETALMKACKRGNGDIVRLLLEYGADCNILSKHHNNAMHFAKQSNNVMVYDYIKDHVATLTSVAEETIRAYFETRLAVLDPVFPLACHRLCEGPDFSLEFNYKPPAHSPAEGTGILLFIFHANFLSEITARLCGPCSVHAVVLNDKFQLPVFLDSHFIYSFSPAAGPNKLFVRLAEAPTAKVKLLICAYRVQLQ